MPETGNAIECKHSFLKIGICSKLHHGKLSPLKISRNETLIAIGANWKLRFQDRPPIGLSPPLSRVFPNLSKVRKKDCNWVPSTYLPSAQDTPVVISQTGGTIADFMRQTTDTNLELINAPNISTSTLNNSLNRTNALKNQMHKHRSDPPSLETRTFQSPESKKFNLLRDESVELILNTMLNPKPGVDI
ncbi:hypothetical protein ACTXT7_015046 [Hymenolepis weldensis]